MTSRFRHLADIHSTSEHTRQDNHCKCHCHKISDTMTRIHDQIEKVTPTEKTGLPL